MFSMSLSRWIPFALCCTYAASLLACSPGSSRPLGGTQIASGKDQMTGAEWSAYVANSQYLQNLSRPGVPVRLNLADPRQYSFAMARLKLAGKTAANSPHLFELIEARRQAQLADGVKVGTVAQTLDVPGGVIEMHYIETADVRLTQAASATGDKHSAVTAGTLATGVASSTFPGGTDYTYLDISVSTIAGNPIAPLAFTEQFDNPDGNPGANVKIPTSGDASSSNLTRYTFESFKFEDLPDGSLAESYVHTEVGSLMPQVPAGLPQLSSPAVDAPKDLVGPNQGAPDNIISVCIDRQWTNDCDYIVDSGAVDKHRIKMPLQGAITLTTSHVFDHDLIDQLRTALDTGAALPPNTEAGKIALVLTVDGGGCDVGTELNPNPGMSAFWDHVTLSADNRTLNWDATAANSLFFAEGCTQVQNVAKLTMRIAAPVKAVPDTGGEFSVSFTISSDPDVQRAYYLPTITLTNSCLAEGTQIDVGDGKLAPIESLHIGQTIFNPYGANHTLTIEDTAKGVERSPMVRIRDAAGRTLLMTEMHPIATPDRGMVQARALHTGDLVMTTEGPSVLVEVSREPYSGKVYNLKVGSETEMAALSSDQTVLHANGFVVGDGQIQHKYEELAMKQGSRTRQVAEKWRRDYELSPSRK